MQDKIIKLPSKVRTERGQIPLNNLPIQLTPLIGREQETKMVCALLLADLLAACSELKILVTSRAVLHIHGEYEFSVPPLAIPDLKHLPELETLSQYAAITLFIQRAQAIKSD